MIITHKIQCFPNRTQVSIINRTLGACRWAYNRFIGYNIEKYKDTKEYTTGYDFSKMITKLKRNDPDYAWLKEISQKAVKQSILDAHERYKKFLKGEEDFPKFKSKHKNPMYSYYLYPVDGIYKHNKILLPVLGWMRICNNSYVITGHIINARMIKDNLGKYFIQLCTEIKPKEKEILSEPVGIDIGINKYLSIVSPSDVHIEDKFIDNRYMTKLENRLSRLQKIITNKANVNYFRLLNKYMDTHNGEEPNEFHKNIMKGESYKSNNISKLWIKIRRIHKKITDYKKNRINKIIARLVKTKPAYIAIEDLSVSNMLSKSDKKSNSTLRKHIQDSMFYYFKTQLIYKCKLNSIEVHLADRYFASSKKCSCCGNKKKNLKLSDRVYKCDECGYIEDRDINAARNLLNMKKKEYTIK